VKPSDERTTFSYQTARFLGKRRVENTVQQSINTRCE
jgi:hypothetical protein